MTARFHKILICFPWVLSNLSKLNPLLQSYQSTSPKLNICVQTRISKLVALDSRYDTPSFSVSFAITRAKRQNLETYWQSDALSSPQNIFLLFYLFCP